MAAPAEAAQGLWPSGGAPEKSYGSTKLALDAQPVGSKEWHALGSPKGLLQDAAIDIGRKCIALGMIVVEVFSSKHYLMSCDVRQVGMTWGFLCEYTKAFVRCFPLLALVISLNVAARQILLQRMYYELLRRGAVLDIENFSPLSDPLFWIVLFCAGSSIGHYFISLWTNYRLDFGDLGGSIQRASSSEFTSNLSGDVVFFVLPVVYFLMFLWSSYDIEAMLVPLNKFMEEDPEDAKQRLSEMSFVTERALKTAVVRDFAGNELSLEAPFDDLVRRGLARIEQSKASPDALDGLSRWRIVTTMWPARFLLDRRLQGPDDISFRMAWYAFSAMALGVSTLVFIFFVRSFTMKAYDVMTGQKVDIAGVVVQALHALLTLALAGSLQLNTAVALWRSASD